MPAYTCVLLIKRELVINISHKGTGMRRPVPSLTAATFDKLKFPIFMHIKPPDDLGLAQLIPTVWWKYATKVSYACSSWGQHSPLFLHNRKSENSHFTVLKNKPQSYKGNKRKRVNEILDYSVCVICEQPLFMASMTQHLESSSAYPGQLHICQNWRSCVW